MSLTHLIRVKVSLGVRARVRARVRIGTHPRYSPVPPLRICTPLRGMVKGTGDSGGGAEGGGGGGDSGGGGGDGGGRSGVRLSQSGAARSGQKHSSQLAHARLV